MTERFWLGVPLKDGARVGLLYLQIAHTGFRSEFAAKLVVDSEPSEDDPIVVLAPADAIDRCTRAWLESIAEMHAKLPVET